MNNLQSFYNFADTTTLTQGNATTLTGFEAVNDATQAFLATNGNAVTWSDFGTNGGKCINFSADWTRFTKSQPFTEPDSGVVVMLFRTQPVQDQYVIFDFGKYKAYCNNGILSFDPAITNADTTMVLQNSQNYILTMRRDGTKGTNEYGGMVWRLEDLGNNTPQSYRGKHFGQTSIGQYEFGGVSTMSAAGTQCSNFIMTTDLLSAVDQAKLELHQRNLFLAQTTVRTSWDFYAMEDNMSAPTDQEKYFNICRCFDTGGDGNPYLNNEAINRKYFTLTGEPMSYQFISYQSEVNYDTLTIYSILADGSYDTANPLLSGYHGTVPPNSGAVVTGAVGSIGIAFVWVSDSSNAQQGWECVCWDSSLVATGSPPTHVTVPIPLNEQLNPVEGEVSEDVTGSFVAELLVNTT